MQTSKTLLIAHSYLPCRPPVDPYVSAALFEYRRADFEVIRYLIQRLMEVRLKHLKAECLVHGTKFALHFRRLEADTCKP